ncbi:MAG: hypothetical protein EXR50_07430, partial [Dehalococcoidia bacterium]|nr:hypothetical protein [Dehalococcoidia bacterium]
MSSTILEEVLQTLNSSPTVSEAFQAASTAVSNAVGQDITDAWALGGAELYTTGSTSWEATLEYFKASPVLAETLGPAPFLSWTKFGTEIGRDSVLVATSFFRASPSMAPALDQEVLAKWVNLGVSIYKYPGAPELLACRFFEASPRLTRDSRYIDTAVLVQILTRVSKWSNDLAVEVLSLSSRLFQVMDDDALQSLLSTASLISEENISCVRPLLDVGLGTYLGMQPEHRPHLLGAISVVDSASPDNLITYLGHVSRFQSSFKGDAGAIVSRFSGLLAKSSITAAREFMKNIPNIIERLDPPMVELWCKEGMSLLKAHEAAGVNFFRFESKEAMDLLYSLTPAVDLQEVRDVLRLYCQALMGKSIAILPAEDITSKGASWSLVEQIPYDGAAIFAPSRMQEFDSKDMNFESYKVLATHQAAHQEFYTYGFSFSKEGAVFQNLRESLERELRQDRSHAVDFERFFSLFPSRNLAKDLFTVAEDARIDHKVSREYRGIRRALQNALDHAVLHRPTPESLNLREAMVEVLLQITLGRSGPFVIPQDHLSILERSSVLLKTMYRDDATV